MSYGRSPKLTEKIASFVRSLGRKLPSFRSSEEIDREYIEGETPEEIGEIGQMTDIPDKSQRHPHTESRSEKKAS